MRIPIRLLLSITPLSLFASYPTPNSVLSGSFTLDGQGAIIDATNLPSFTGYFLKSGSLDISNVTLENFATQGGSGSGGGAGLGGTIFINQGGTLNLSNVNFYGSSITGGTGGLGDTGGVLNNVLTPTSNGTNGANGSDAGNLSAFTNKGNGTSGSGGSAGGNATDGFGGNAGHGGKGSIGLPTSSDTILAAFQQAQAIANEAKDSTAAAELATIIPIIDAAIAASESLNANPVLTGYPLVASGVFIPISAAITAIELLIAETAGIQDIAAVAASAAYFTATSITAYVVDGSSGIGGPGGAGNDAGNGSFGFGGGRGGDGGKGGDATPGSIALGGPGGTSGNGGNGGYGGGGGRSGIPGVSGKNGNLASGGTITALSGEAGLGGFAAGNGSFGAIAPNGTGGGAGSGFGGAIFLRSGATLNITGPAVFCGNLALAGTSVNEGISGEAAGSDIFLSTGCTFSIDPGSGNTVVFDGTIADDSSTSLKSSPYGDGAGAGVTIKSGLVIFTDHGSNTYSGPTLISGGVLQAQDGIGVNFSSNIHLAGGVFEGHGLLDRFLGPRSGNLQFSGSGVSSGFSSAQGDFNVVLNCGQPLVWDSTPYFLTNGADLLFGSPSAEDTVIFSNPINLNGANRTILATAGLDNANRAILTGALSNGSLTVGDLAHTGKVVLDADNTYLGPTQISGGSLILRGSLASTLITIDSGATLESVHSGLSNLTDLTVNGTFIIDANNEIATLAGSGQINLNAGILTLNSGTFSGVIAGTNPTSGISKVTTGTLTLSGSNTFVGPTNLDDGTLDLTGTLGSQTISISPGSIFLDVNGGISNTASVTDNGTLNLGASQTIGALLGNGSVSIQLASLTVGSGNFSGVISGLNPVFGLFKNTPGTFILSGNNTYTGFTEIDAGSLTLQGTLASPIVNVLAGGVLEDVNGGLLAAPVLTVDGLFILDASDTITTLNGSGSVDLNGGILSIADGVFSGSITGTNLSSGIAKISAGTLTLSGINTYVGSTAVNAGILTLTGTLGSQTISIASGATLQALSAGLSNLATLTNNGILYLESDNTIASLVNSGEIDGINTLTAATYLLQNGSNINANLGAGTLTTTGTVDLNGTSGATTVNVSAASTFNLGGDQRLSSLADVNIASTGTLNVNGTTQAINTLNGAGNLFANTFQVNNGGTYSGLVDTTNFVVGGGTMNFNGAIVFSNFFTVDTKSILNATANAKISNGTDITVQSNASMNVTTGSQVFAGGNFFLKTSATLTLDATGSLKATNIITEANSIISLPDSSKLTYQLLTGNGIIDSQGNTFVNVSTVGGNLTFLNSFLNQGTLKPGNSPGLTTIVGNYTEASHLVLEIENTTPVTGFSQVRVGGIATLLPSSVFDVQMNSSALVPGNFFQVIATGGGGPIAVNGVLGSLTLTVNMIPANPNAILFDLSTGRIIVTSINPFGPVNPSDVATLGCSANESKAAKSIFDAAFVASQQLNSDTVAGQLAIKILESDICSNLAFFTPTFYGAMTDYAFLGERSLASQVWNRVSPFTSLSKRCCNKFSVFGGYLHADQRKIHHTNLSRRDLFAGLDYRTCYDFSIGFAVSDPWGKIHAKLGTDHVNGITGLGYFRAGLSRSWALYGTVAGSHLNNHIHRPTLFGAIKSHATSSSVTGFLGLQYRKWTYRKFAFTPRANLVYSSAHVGKFKEKGALDALIDSGFNAGFFTGEVGFSSFFSTRIARRPFGLEATAGVEMPISSYKNRMELQIAASPNIDYSLPLPNSTKTRVRGQLNAGYMIWNNVTVNTGYQLSSGGNWDHLFTAGLRFCLQKTKKKSANQKSTSFFDKFKGS